LNCDRQNVISRVLSAREKQVNEWLNLEKGLFGALTALPARKTGGQLRKEIKDESNQN
jgi:hypothetical protein